MCMPMLCTTKTANGIRRAITLDIGDRVILDLVGLDADDSPVARHVHVVDVAPLDLVRAQHRPPDVLCCWCV